METMTEPAAPPAAPKVADPMKVAPPPVTPVEPAEGEVRRPTAAEAAHVITSATPVIIPPIGDSVPAALTPPAVVDPMRAQIPPQGKQQGKGKKGK
jgi:hypothetical protein